MEPLRIIVFAIVLIAGTAMLIWLNRPLLPPGARRGKPQPKSADQVSVTALLATRLDARNAPGQQTGSPMSGPTPLSAEQARQWLDEFLVRQQKSE
jgi:hypothetical protein